jgi:hypothetical protein
MSPAAGLAARHYDLAQFHTWVAECSRRLMAHGFAAPTAAEKPPH